MHRYLCTRLTLAAVLCCLAADKPLKAQLDKDEAAARESQQRLLFLNQKQRAEANRLRLLDAEQRGFVIAGNLNFQRLMPPNGGSVTLKLVEIGGKPQFRVSVVRVNGGPAPHQLELGKENEDQIIRHFVSQCELYCDGVFQAANIANEQLEKLKGAATLDAVRFIRGLRADFSGTAEEQQARGFNPLQAYRDANNDLNLAITSPQSLFRKVLYTQLTSEQRAELYRGLASPLIRAINDTEKLSLDAQVRKLGRSYPEPGEEARSFVPLQPEQQASLLKRIVDHHSDLTDLLELSER